MDNFQKYQHEDKFIKLCEDVASIKTDMTILKEMKPKVDKHETAYTIFKWSAAPILVTFHIAVHSTLKKLGLI